MFPDRISQNGSDELLIEWNDKHFGLHKLKSLRDLCPCASCVDSRSYIQAEEFIDKKAQKYHIKEIIQIGSYAIKITWDDNHDTGIYPFDYLRTICECTNCSMNRENI
jgi:DUF971 family protein